MASKKDKFRRQVQKELGQDPESDSTASGKNAREPSDAGDQMSGLVSDVRKEREKKDGTRRLPGSMSSDQEPSGGNRNRNTGKDRMARSRNVYNVSSDVRLEDYTEKGESRDFGPILRIVGVILVVLLIAFGIYRAVGWLMMPSYQLAIAGQEITDSNLEQFSSGVVNIQPGQPLHIRFQWPVGTLETDYLRITVEKAEGASYAEEAVMGRRPPRTANYIYFMGPMDAGAYRVIVTDAGGSVLSSREVVVR